MKKIVLERWLQNHPAPSWAVVAEALYQMKEHDSLEQVKKTYFTGMLECHRVYIIVGQYAVIVYESLCDTCLDPLNRYT